MTQAITKLIQGVVDLQYKSGTFSPVGVIDAGEGPTILGKIEITKIAIIVGFRKNRFMKKSEEKSIHTVPLIVQIGKRDIQSLSLNAK